MFRANILGLMIAIILLQSTLCDDSYKDTLAGGYADQKIRECYEAIRKGYNESLHHFTSHRITKCETQVVAGLNFRVTLHKTGDEVPDCNFVIYRDLSDNYSLTVRDDSKDCVKQAKDHGLVVDTSN